jgi:hypothetical protein
MMMERSRKIGVVITAGILIGSCFFVLGLRVSAADDDGEHEYSVGDYWEYEYNLNQTQDGVTTSGSGDATIDLVREETVNGYDCWVFEAKIDLELTLGGQKVSAKATELSYVDKTTEGVVKREATREFSMEENSEENSEEKETWVFEKPYQPTSSLKVRETQVGSMNYTYTYIVGDNTPERESKTVGFNLTCGSTNTTRVEAGTFNTTVVHSWDNLTVSGLKTETNATIYWSPEVGQSVMEVGNSTSDGLFQTLTIELTSYGHREKPFNWLWVIVPVIVVVAAVAILLVWKRQKGQKVETKRRKRRKPKKEKEPKWKD